MACLKDVGKIAVDREAFIMAKMWGETVVNTSFNSLVGMGSSCEVEDFMERMIFSNV